MAVIIHISAVYTAISATTMSCYPEILQQDFFHLLWPTRGDWWILQNHKYCFYYTSMFIFFPVAQVFQCISMEHKEQPSSLK